MWNYSYCQIGVVYYFIDNSTGFSKRKIGIMKTQDNSMAQMDTQMCMKGLDKCKHCQDCDCGPKFTIILFWTLT